MEPRKVTVINSRTQSQSVISESTAATLGELKREMDSAGINYEGMSFFEGHMRAELQDDASPLPETVSYKGQDVRDLVFMLSPAKKHITSGASRSELYDQIKKEGLQDECKKRFGKNFTQCSSEDLESLLKSRSGKKTGKPEVTDTSIEAAPLQAVDRGCRDAIYVLVNLLYDEDYISGCERTQVLECLDIKDDKKDDRLSQKEIDGMFDFIGR